MASVVHAGNVDAIKNVFKRAAAFFLRLQVVKTVKQSFRSDVGRVSRPVQIQTDQDRPGIPSCVLLSALNRRTTTDAAAIANAAVINVAVP